MKGSLWKVAIVFVFLALLLPAIGLGYGDATHANDVDNESIVLEQGEAIDVELADDAFVCGPTTQLEANDSELEEGIHYDWNASDCHVTLVDGEYDGETGGISYTAEEHDDGTETIAALLGVFDSWIAILALIVVVGAIWAMTSFGGGGR